MSKINELKELADLKEQGVLTEQEFQNEKEKILNESVSRNKKNIIFDKKKQKIIILSIITTSFLGIICLFILLHKNIDERISDVVKHVINLKEKQNNTKSSEEDIKNMILKVSDNYKRGIITEDFLDCIMNSEKYEQTRVCEQEAKKKKEETYKKFTENLKKIITIFLTKNTTEFSEKVDNIVVYVLIEIKSIVTKDLTEQKKIIDCVVTDSERCEKIIELIKKAIEIHSYISRITLNYSKILIDESKLNLSEEQILKINNNNYNIIAETYKLKESKDDLMSCIENVTSIKESIEKCYYFKQFETIKLSDKLKKAITNYLTISTISKLTYLTQDELNEIINKEIPIVFEMYNNSSNNEFEKTDDEFLDCMVNSKDMNDIDVCIKKNTENRKKIKQKLIKNKIYSAINKLSLINSNEGGFPFPDFLKEQMFDSVLTKFNSGKIDENYLDCVIKSDNSNDLKICNQ